MARPFKVYVPLESAYTRRVLFAVEVRDAVSLQRLTTGLQVTATGVAGAPYVNFGGDFVWLEEGPARPQRVKVDPGTLPYESADVDVSVLPATRLVSIELSPRRDYGFAVGTLGIRATLVEQRNGPIVRVPNAEVWLRWIDDQNAWIDAPTHSHTDGNGDFVAFLRLMPTQNPGLDAASQVRARVAALRAGATRASPEFSLPQGRVADTPPTFAWDEFQP
jgi:hypothetical protein